MIGRVTVALSVAALLAVPAVAQDERGYPGDRDRDQRYQDQGYPNQGYAGQGYQGQGYQGQGGGQQMRCESWQYQPARCAIDARGGVALVQVIAGNCIQGQTWGFDRGSIWVGGGCRAIFASRGGGYPGGGGGYPGNGGYPGGGYPGGGYPGGQPTEIVCQSWQYQPARCPIGPGRRADITQVIAGDCIPGRTWGVDRGGIWVNNGCRARFRAY